jgi:hypothetical protein
MADREQSGFGLQRALGADLQHVYGQDYSQRTEEVPDESPGLGERLNTCFLKLETRSSFLTSLV